MLGQEFFPVDQVRAGQRAIGKTVFQGTEVEEFEIEILGVLENFAGPKSSVIFGKLSGGPLARTGVMSGMSGSPVYIDGRLAGAVALMFPFSKEPLAGIRPIGEMVAGFEEGTPSSSPLAAGPLDDWRELAGMPRVAQHRVFSVAGSVRRNGPRQVLYALTLPESLPASGPRCWAP